MAQKKVTGRQLDVDLSDINDIDFSAAPSNGDILTFNGTNWVSAAPAGGSLAIDDLTDVDTTTVAPILQQALRWNGTNWVPGAVSSLELLPVKLVNLSFFNPTGTGGLAAIDGITPVAGDRILLTGSSSNNGIWIAAAGAWSRAPDFSQGSDFIVGKNVLVTQGASFAQTRWFVHTVSTPGIVGGNEWTTVSALSAPIDGTTYYPPSTAGFAAIALGYGPSASQRTRADNTFSVAIGSQANAGGNTGIAMGYQSTAMGDGTISLGNQAAYPFVALTSTFTNSSIFIGGNSGQFSPTSGTWVPTQAVALGYRASPARGSVAIGPLARTDAGESIAIGNNARVRERDGIAIGDGANSLRDEVCIGYLAGSTSTAVTSQPFRNICIGWNAKTNSTAAIDNISNIVIGTDSTSADKRYTAMLGGGLIADFDGEVSIGTGSSSVVNRRKLSFFKGWISNTGAGEATAVTNQIGIYNTDSALYGSSSVGPIPILSNSFYIFKFNFIGKSRTDQSKVAAFDIVLCVNSVGTTISIAGTPTKTVLVDTNSTPWDVTWAVDNTNKELDMFVTSYSPAAATVDWFMTCQVTFMSQT